ncbi:MAG: NAD(P)-dependent oxidoreductase [Burkholderiaceae bacterium]
MKAGIIGTGAMGAGIAANLLNRHRDVHVRDIISSREDPLVDRGGVRQATPASMVGAVDAVLIVVETAAQIREVVNGPDGLLAGLAHADKQTAAPGIFLCSTIAPEDTVEIAAALTQAGAAVIDAPISGGPERAGDGTMSIMLAGAAEHRQRFADLLNDLSDKQFVVSDRPGDGARAKLANNLAGGAYLAAASEALAMAVSMGLDADIMMRLMAASSGQSWVGDDRLPRGAAGLMPTVGAAARVLTKDLTLAVAAAGSAGSPSPMAQAALARFEAACEQGMGEMDDSCLFTLYRQEAKR